MHIGRPGRFLPLARRVARPVVAEGEACCWPQPQPCGGCWPPAVTTAGIDDQDAANSMLYKVTADTTFKVYNVDAVTGTTVSGDGVFISSDDSDAGRAAYIVCRVNYLRPSKAVTWDDVSKDRKNFIAKGIIK